MAVQLEMRVRLLVLLTVLLSVVPVEVSYAATTPFPGIRPFNLSVPTSYNRAIPEPLIIGLSGYNQTGADFERYLNLEPLTNSSGILYVYPDGAKDSRKVRFWNGTPECCDFEYPKVDDDAYIMSVIDKVSAQYAVDPLRIYIIGHSNGGFLASALACNHSDRIAAIVSMAGASYTTAAACKVRSPISVLEIWGSKDPTFSGNHIRGRPIPGALQIFNTWGAINQCSPITVSSPNSLDLDSKVPGPETTVTEFQQCPAETAVDLWRIAGAGHRPRLSSNFDAQIINFLLAHPKSSSN